MTTGDPVRVFLLDDHEIVRVGVRDLVNTAPDLVVVGEAENAAAAVAAVGGLDVDVAVIDIRLDGGDGIEACRAITERHPGIACLMLTAFDDDEARIDAAEAGAAGFLLKQVRGNEIVESIRKVAAGAQLLDEASLRLARRRLGAGEAGLVDHLTEQESRILQLIGDGLTNRQIGAELDIAEKTVKNHVTSLLAKLQLERRTEAAALATRLTERRRGRFS